MSPRLSATVTALLLTAGCAGDPRDGRDETEPTAPPPVEAPSALASAAPVVSAPPADAACPSDMVLVDGRYCPALQQRCLARQQVGVGAPVQRPEALNCERYAQPSVCLRPDVLEHVRVCMDRYEWPNEAGALPRTLTTWVDAKATCESVGKRLCSESEFTFACEGEAMRPFVYGFERDATKCNIDRPYRPRTFRFLPWEPCMADGACKAAFDAMDQREPAGSRPGCVSPEGVFDLNGNANEWVDNPKGLEHRAGIKGGWWGPVRNRCRPIVTFHAPGDFGYEVGFRCCRDPSR